MSERLRVYVCVYLGVSVYVYISLYGVYVHVECVVCLNVYMCVYVCIGCW